MSAFKKMILNLYFSCFQRASQIRSVPFTGDSSDSDSDCGGLDGHGSSRLLAAPEDVFDGVFRGTSSAASRNTNSATNTTTMTSSTSGEMSLSSPRGLNQLKIASQPQHPLASVASVAHSGVFDKLAIGNLMHL